MKIIGAPVIDPDILANMLKKRGRWAAYQNQSQGHPDYGHVSFFQFGIRTDAVPPPDRHPYRATIQGWHYVLVGLVDVERGVILPLKGEEPTERVEDPPPHPDGTPRVTKNEAQAAADLASAQPGVPNPPVPPAPPTENPVPSEKIEPPLSEPSAPISTGVPSLDEAMSGGIPPESLPKITGEVPALGTPPLAGEVPRADETPPPNP